MTDPNLFSRLAAYSQNPLKQNIENFCTELLAYFFNHDVVFKRRFLAVVFNDQRSARAFLHAKATTQETLSNDCRVDLVLRRRAHEHLIEVKISAAETRSGRWGQTGKPQVQRYVDLRRGDVTYLTTRESPPPEVDHRGRKFKLAKHALFEELYLELSTARLRPLTRIFVEFMKNHDMAGPEPFERKELKRAEQALAIIEKCSGTLAIVANEVNAQFKANFKTRCNLTRPTIKTWGVQSYLPKYKRGAVKWVGFSLEPRDGEIAFDVWMTGTLHPSIARIRKHLGWDELDGYSGCYSKIHLHGNHNDIARMVAHAKAASKKLGRAIRRFA